MELSAASYEILNKEELTDGIFDLWIRYPDAANVKPGQFVGVKCNGFTLRRPISVCELGPERMRLVIEVRGEGTEWISRLCKGDALDILSPLGNGFQLGDTGRKAVFVGGGIGVPPLLEAAKPFGKNADVILGFRKASAVILTDDFRRAGCRVTLATEDGSAGVKGFITGPLKERLDAGDCGVLFACGPKAMLKVVAEEADARSIPCFVSMEERMACGVGACLSCVCKTKFEGKEQYSHVCKNGPVFDAKRIVW